MRKEGKAVHAIAHLYLILGVLLVLFPLYLLLVVSFKPLAASAANFIAFPKALYLENFKKVLSLGLYVNSIKNSVIVVVVPLLFITTLVPMASFAIARNAKRKRYYRYLYRYVIASLFVPFNAIMIPIVILSSKLDMMNIPGLIVLYVSLSFSQGTFLFVGYIRSLPAELDESAYMDGCSVPRLFVSIIMPLCKPMIITIIILNSLWYWNDFMLPVVILNKSKYYQTLALFQYMFNDPYNFQYNLGFASYLMGMIPLLIVYLVAQKRVIGGLTSGALKG